VAAIYTWSGGQSTAVKIAIDDGLGRPPTAGDRLWRDSTHQISTIFNFICTLLKYVVVNVFGNRNCIEAVQLL